MSIIYDALKKVEKNNFIGLDPAALGQKVQKSKTNVLLLYALAICFCILIGNLFFGFLVPKKKGASHAFKPVSSLPPATSAVLVKAYPVKEPVKTVTPLKEQQKPVIKNQEQPSLVLSGVFFSTQEGYALINNKIVRVGDEIEGAVVKKIKPNEVELQNSSGLFTLSIN